jgi:hypothetical protein
MIDRSAFAHPIAEVVEVVGEPVIGWAKPQRSICGEEVRTLSVDTGGTVQLRTSERIIRAE